MDKGNLFKMDIRIWGMNHYFPYSYIKLDWKGYTPFSDRPTFCHISSSFGYSLVAVRFVPRLPILALLATFRSCNLPTRPWLPICCKPICFSTAYQTAALLLRAARLLHIVSYIHTPTFYLQPTTVSHFAYILLFSLAWPVCSLYLIQPQLSTAYVSLVLYSCTIDLLPVDWTYTPSTLWICYHEQPLGRALAIQMSLL